MKITLRLVVADPRDDRSEEQRELEHPSRQIIGEASRFSSR